MPLKPYFKVISHDSVDSTQLEAKRYIEDALNNGSLLPIDMLAITSKQQTAGIGRLGRSWEFIPGNLALSLIISERTFADTAACSKNIIGFMLALALGQVLEDIGVDFAYKWPNDILIDGKKLSGILVQNYQAHFIAGIGVNLIAAPQLSDNSGSEQDGVFLNQVLNFMQKDRAKKCSILPGSNFTPCALAEYSKKLLDRDEFLQTLLTSIQRTMCLDNNTVLAKWQERAYKMGQRIDVKQQNQVVSGVMQGIDASGGLILEQDTGTRVTILFGDINASGN